MVISTVIHPNVRYQSEALTYIFK